MCVLVCVMYILYVHVILHRFNKVMFISRRNVCSHVLMWEKFHSIQDSLSCSDMLTPGPILGSNYTATNCTPKLCRQHSVWISKHSLKH